MAAYYNEFEPYAAEWLRNLIKAGHIADGIVDERSIEDVVPAELAEFTQCHFFAGIGVWSHALRRAGWADDVPVWTGSCPCQPFSSAGAGAGFDDQRHLWPHFHWLIQQCRPAVVFGEQVASKDAEPWIDLVQTDLEGLGYGVGAVPFPAAGVGAPHIRDRLYWMAYDQIGGRGRERQDTGRGATRNRAKGVSAGSLPGGSVGGMAHYHGDGCEQGRQGFPPVGHRSPAESDRSAGRVADADGGHASAERQQYGGQFGLHSQDRGDLRQSDQGARIGLAGASASAGPVNGFWRDADWLGCRDGKFRPVEPGTFPLVDGAAARVGRLRAYGNAICAEAALVFIQSAMECLP